MWTAIAHESETLNNRVTLHLAICLCDTTWLRRVISPSRSFLTDMISQYGGVSAMSWSLTQTWLQLQE